jgi:hypothetical protein
MGSVPISTASSGPRSQTRSLQAGSGGHDKPMDWTQLLIAGTLVASGTMILTGHKRSGAAVAAAGAALALIEEQDTVVEWWKKLPQVLGQAQDFLVRVEHYLDEAATQGHRIQNILRR